MNTATPMTGSQVVDTLLTDPAFVYDGDWAVITDPVDWLRLLAIRPEFASNCPCNHGWDHLKAWEWMSKSGPVVVVLLPQDIKRTRRRETTYGPDRYPYSARIDLDAPENRYQPAGRLAGLLDIYSSARTLSLNGAAMDGDDEFDATSFVQHTRAWFESHETAVKVLYLEYLAGIARCRDDGRNHYFHQIQRGVH